MNASCHDFCGFLSSVSTGFLESMPILLCGVFTSITVTKLLPYTTQSVVTWIPGPWATVWQNGCQRNKTAYLSVAFPVT